MNHNTTYLDCIVFLSVSCCASLFFQQFHWSISSFGKVKASYSHNQLLHHIKWFCVSWLAAALSFIDWRIYNADKWKKESGGNLHICAISSTRFHNKIIQSSNKQNYVCMLYFILLLKSRPFKTLLICITFNVTADTWSFSYCSEMV